LQPLDLHALKVFKVDTGLAPESALLIANHIDEPLNDVLIAISAGKIVFDQLGSDSLFFYPVMPLAEMTASQIELMGRSGLAISPENIILLDRTFLASMNLDSQERIEQLAEALHSVVRFTEELEGQSKKTIKSLLQFFGESERITKEFELTTELCINGIVKYHKNLGNSNVYLSLEDTLNLIRDAISISD